MISSSLIDMNPFEFKYYPFTISLSKCIGSCIVLPPKTYVQKEIKDMLKHLI